MSTRSAQHFLTFLFSVAGERAGSAPLKGIGE
jgi:hypothetical protein